MVGLANFILGERATITDRDLRHAGTRALSDEAALVDQIRGFDERRELLAERDPRARLWFGRYTGSTLGGGVPTEAR